MERYLVTLRTHAGAEADEIFVDVREASPVRAVAAAVRACAGMGPFALLRAVPWPKGVRSADHAARRLAAGA